MKAIETEILNKLQDVYTLSPAAASVVFECVAALDKYDKLPDFCKESLQSIADLYNVSFTFNVSRRGALILAGITNNICSSFLYTDIAAYKKAVKSCRNKQKYSKPTASLEPFAGGKLTAWTVLNTDTGEEEEYNGKQ